MRVRHLQTKFIAAGVLLVMATIVSGIWSAWTFARLSTVTGETLRSSQQTTDLAATLSNALEREDDAFLLATSGDHQRAKQELLAQRLRFAVSYGRLLATLSDADEQRAAAKLQQHVNEYRDAGDIVLSMPAGQDATRVYQQRVNPALRRAVADCTEIRELNFRSMQFSAMQARDAAGAATILVVAISAAALLISTLIAVTLARSVLMPVRELSSSIEALREGDFDRRVRVMSADELGQLAVGFNRMAETLVEFRRSNLGEVLRAKETLESTVEALPDAVIVINPEGQIIARNPLAKSVLKAIGADEVKSIEGLPFPPATLSAIQAALQGKRSAETRAEFSRAFPVSLEGRRAKFMLTVVPIPGFWKGRFGAVTILYDVTDFARLDELRMELVGVASHELKTPLTTLRMNLMLLGENEENLSARQREMLATAVLGCQELASTIDELLDLTRIEAGQLRLDQDTVDLYAVIGRSIASLRQRYEDGGVTVRLLSECQPALVRGDAARLGTVFVNLLSNALKYTPQSGSVSIRVTAEHNEIGKRESHLQVAVTDTGPGIPPQYRERVFDKFFRIETHLGDGQGSTWGSGIGLYLCRQIVEAHGGEILCEAGDDGVGTRIVLHLPRVLNFADAADQPRGLLWSSRQNAGK
jgi:NtrC-family two-component system sensor histidine kinase KinB